MKVKCIDNLGWTNLTIGKTYDVIKYKGTWYYIINDEKQECGYLKIYFRPLSEIRNETINKLLE